MKECSDFAIEYIHLFFKGFLENIESFFENAYYGEPSGLVLNAPVVSLFLVSREIALFVKNHLSTKEFNSCNSVTVMHT